MHANLQGIVADDSSFVTNAIVDGEYTPQNGSFKIAELPSVYTVVTMRVRLKAVGTDLSNGTVSVDLYQGEPRDGTKIAEIDFPADIPGGRAALVAGTWYDLTKAVVINLITDPSDVWTHVRMSRGTGLSDLVSRMSWLVLDVTFPFGSGETPTFKNYVNSLTKITNVSVRAVGTTGTSRYCYRVVPCDSDGVCGPASDEVVVTDGNASLDATDHICLSWLDDVGATSYKVYRTCAPSGLGLGLLATVLPNLGDCGTGGGGGGDTGYKDDGTDCVTDCAELFDLDDLEGCQGVTTVSIGSKETPTTVTYPAKESPT